MPVPDILGMSGEAYSPCITQWSSKPYPPADSKVRFLLVDVCESDCRAYPPHYRRWQARFSTSTCNLKSKTLNSNTPSLGIRSVLVMEPDIEIQRLFLGREVVYMYIFHNTESQVAVPYNSSTGKRGIICMVLVLSQ